MACRPAPTTPRFWGAGTKQDPQFFQILIREIRKDAEVNAIFEETLGVLGHAEFLEPVRNLLHRGDQQACSRAEFSPVATDRLYPCLHDSHVSAFASMDMDQMSLPIEKF
jgi:hypothetical protein